MRLRSQLVLFFGVAMGIIAAALVGLTQHQTRTNLLEDIRRGLASRGRFEARQAELLVQFHLLAYRVNERTHQDHTKFVGGQMDVLLKTSSFRDIVVKLSKARQHSSPVWTQDETAADETAAEQGKSTPDQALKRLFWGLQNLAYDVGSDLIKDSGGVLDLLGLTMRDGQPYLILTTDAQGQVAADNAPLSPPDVPPALQALIASAIQEGMAQGFILHSDGNLYFVYCANLPAHGVAVLGHRLDERTLKVASSGSDQEVAVVSHERALVPSKDPKLAKALLAMPVGQPGQVMDVTLAGHRYLVSPVALHANVADERSEITAWAYNLRSLDSVEIYLSRMTEGIAGVGIVSLLLGILAIRILSGRVTTPIERLAVKMGRVGDGDLTQKMESEGSYEVQQAGQAFNRMVEDLRQKEMLAKMVPKQAREAIAKSEVVGGRVAGRRLKTTILFSDIRGFTSLSEQLTPAEVMGLLDIYLSRMTTVIENAGGDVNEYIGDAILADFEDRDGQSGAARAVRAAFEMTRALADLKAQDLHPQLRGLRQGIGLNTGELVKGEIGASDRSKFAMVGDAVNLAARVQDRSRDGQHTCILVTDATYQEAGSEYEFALFGDEEFKGKSGKIRVWEVTGPVSRSASVLRPSGDMPPIGGA